jgi:hypothetical protein
LERGFDVCTRKDTRPLVNRNSLAAHPGSAAARRLDLSAQANSFAPLYRGVVRHAGLTFLERNARLTALT